VGSGVNEKLHSWYGTKTGSIMQKRLAIPISGLHQIGIVLEGCSQNVFVHDVILIASIGTRKNLAPFFSSRYAMS